MSSGNSEKISRDLQSATILTALEMSQVAYDVYLSTGFLGQDATGATDPRYSDVTCNGWIPITDLPGQNVIRDHYQGVAFYKVINGATEVIIANRGSQPGGVTKLWDFTHSDAALALGATPDCDADAVAYYQSVTAWLQVNVTGTVNIIETGHSLGGQEADYVDVQVTNGKVPGVGSNLGYTLKAVTFDAPGIARGLAAAGTIYDALNISASQDFVHVGGALFNGGYAGSSVTVKAGTPLMPYAVLNLVGLAAGGPLGIALAAAGLGGFAFTGLYKNHVASRLLSYLTDHPALGGVDLQKYEPIQVTQELVKQLASVTPTAYLAMALDQKAAFYQGLLKDMSGGGSSAGRDGEVFTVSTTDSGVVLTGSMGDQINLSNSDNTVELDDSAGNKDVLTFSADGTTLLSDSWSSANGSHGENTHDSSGSGSGKTVYASGGYATYFNDGQGNVTTDYYTKAGNLYAAGWVHSDGTSGTITQMQDGFTRLPGSPSNFDVPTTAYITIRNPDGSYVVKTWDRLDEAIVRNFDASGAVTSTTQTQGDGQNFDISDVTTTTRQDATGDTFTDAYDAQGHHVWRSWKNTSGSSGKTTFNASGVEFTKEVNADHTGDSYTIDGSDETHDRFDSDGNLTSDDWSLRDGAAGSDSFNADGSGSGTIHHADGSTSTLTIDASMSIKVDNQGRDGRTLSEDWWNPDGTHGITSYNNNDGSKTTYTYQTNGLVQKVQYAANGSVASQETVRAGMVTSPDGSQFGKTVQWDGLVTISYTDSNGDSLSFELDGSNHLKGTHASDTDSVSEFSITLANGQVASSPYNAYTAPSTGADGTRHLYYFDATGKETGDDWTKPDSHGYDIFQSDGSSNGYSYNADGSFYAYSDDHQGDKTTDYYASNGALTGDVWQAADGTHGFENFNADGSSVAVTYAVNNSYTQYQDDGKGDLGDFSYSATGELLTDRWSKSDGSYGYDSFNTDSSISYWANSLFAKEVWKAVGGDSVTFNFDSTGKLITQTWTRSTGYSFTDDVSLGGTGTQTTPVLDGTSAASVAGTASGAVILAWGNHDTLSSGGGTTVIDALGADALVSGGSGNDTLDALGAGTTLVGGLGNEVFEVNDSTDVIQTQSGAASNIVYASVSFKLNGPVNKLILTGQGNLDETVDSANVAITANDGHDTITAAGDGDSITAGAGGDQILANGSSVSITGGSGADTITATGQSDTIVAGTGGTQITATGNWAVISGSTNAGAGRDTITASGAADSISAGAGGAVISAAGAGDTITAGAGNAVITATGDWALISGGSGHDTINASGQSDTIHAGSAGDVITVSGNYSRVFGGSGHDSLTALGTQDTLIAGSGFDTLVAGTGDDVLKGLAEDTYVFESGFGADEVSTAGASGKFVFGAGISPPDLTLSAITGSDGQSALLIQDGNGAITVEGGFGTINSFQFADGTTLTLDALLSVAHVRDSTAAGPLGDLRLDGSNSTSLSGGTGNDTLYATGSNDTLVAGSGDQGLHGLGSGDVLVGGPGNDTLWGGSGDDTLLAGAGATTLVGGHGADMYQLAQGGTTTIRPGSHPGVEVLGLPAGMSLSSFTSFRTGDDLILASFDGQTVAVVENYYASDANKLWFLTSDNDSAVLLNDWIAAGSGGSADYASKVTSLRQAYHSASAVQLNQIGKAGHTLGTLFDVPMQNYLDTSTPVSSYTFNGVTQTQLSVTNGVLNLGSSESGEDQYQSVTTSRQVTVPVYTGEWVPGKSVGFVPLEKAPVQSGGFIQTDWATWQPFYEDVQTEHGIEQQLLGWFVSLPPTYEEVQTGTRVETITETSNSYVSTRSFTQYAVTGDSGNDVITSTGPFTGTVVLGDGDNLVNLGTTSTRRPDWISGNYSGTSVPLNSGATGVGAFIQAGNGNDTLIGTDGNDVIAAGLGFDSIDGGIGGDTYYVPLQGYSTEIISDSGSPDLMDLLTGGRLTGGPDDGYGGEYQTPGPGAFPLDTLVLPTGVKPTDLSYRVFQDPDNPALQRLELIYGTSSVLINFAAPPSFAAVPRDPVNWWNVGHPELTTPASVGVDLFKFADGTVLTRDQLLAQATLLPNDFNPVVREANLSLLQAGQEVAASTLFTVSDAVDAPITWYRFADDGAGGGYFLLNGHREASGQSFMINAGQLADLTYVAGTSTDAIAISAFDGAMWSTKVQASAADQLIQGPATGPDTLVGGYGGDTLAGGSGLDTFLYDAGSGPETILETATYSETSHNVLLFGTGITPASLALSLSGDGQLVLSVGSGGDSVTIEGFNAANPLQSTTIQQFAFADGTRLSLLQLLSDSSVNGRSGTLANADGTTTTYHFNPSGSDIYSANHYAMDGSHTVTTVSNPSDGSGVTRTVDTYDAQGDRTASAVNQPDGSTENYTFNLQGKILTDHRTTPSGATYDTSFVYNTDDSYVRTVVATVPWSASPTTTVDDLDAQGNILKENTYTPSPDGSYTDSWWSHDGSHGSYGWSASGEQYQEMWVRSDGSSWNDSYVYEGGGSPGSPESSFTETYWASDGSRGSRAFDAGSGTTTLDWYSPTTGELTGTATDGGFIGLQRDGELTNTQPDLTFFNPAVSPSFSAFLAGH